MPQRNFSFQRYAGEFDRHISASIPGYKRLTEIVCDLSPRFVQDGTEVIDAGCSTGRLLRAIRRRNEEARPAVRYVGLDVERSFAPHWKNARNLRFEHSDARRYPFSDTSLTCSIFTLQFIPEPDKLPLLHRIHNGLVPGGALILAEKLLAVTPMMQDAITFPYYDGKLRRGFNAQHILDKERSLRGVMTCWTLDELVGKLRRVGFGPVQIIWGDCLFTAFVAVRGPLLRQAQVLPWRPPNRDQEEAMLFEAA